MFASSRKPHRNSKPDSEGNLFILYSNGHSRRFYLLLREYGFDFFLHHVDDGDKDVFYFKRLGIIIKISLSDRSGLGISPSAYYEFFNLDTDPDLHIHCYNYKIRLHEFRDQIKYLVELEGEVIYNANLNLRLSHLSEEETIAYLDDCFDYSKRFRVEQNFKLS